MFNTDEYTTVLENLSARAHRGCGQVYEVFVRRFTELVNNECPKIPSEHQDRFIGLARSRFDYCDEPDEPTEGFCMHGFPENCCPLGCDDI